jgi:amino acid adenylation domain-containing protein
MNRLETGLISQTFVDDQLEQEKEYWLNKLAGDLPVTGLPLDFNRPAEFSDKREVHPLHIQPEDAARLLAICANKETLVFAILVSILKICLYKYTGVEDVIVGTGIHERYGEVASLNKVLALRSQVKGSLTVRELLEDVRRMLSEGYAHQKFPFKRVVELLNVESPGNQAPLFNVVVILENINNRANISHLMNDLTLVFSIADARIGGAVEYHPALFERKNIELFAEHYRTILRAVLDRPEAKIAELELLSPDKKHELVFAFNATQRVYPKNEPVHRLFEAQVQKTPQHIAAIFGAESLTYLELNQRANQLSRYLRTIGISRGGRVGIYLEHSLETLVALLGVLKAGGVYVPFEPAHPAARLAFMLEDAEIPVVLTQQQLLERIPCHGPKSICLDTAWPSIAAESEENLTDEVMGEDIAYIMYTSGSTGEPKGVIIQHAALTNYICWAAEVYQFKPETGVPLYSSLAFDLTVTSIYTPLVSGGRVIVYRQDRRASPLVEILCDERLEVLKLTPSHLSLIKDQDNSRSPIKRLIVGGEALETELANRIYRSFGQHVEIFNEYGPTEATVACMIHKFDPVFDTRAFVPIGRPAGNAQTYILDKDLRPVAENIVGDLYISGDGLAQGYLNRDSLTSERFIENPFLPQSRMYKSGDLARWLPEGIIEFVGRADEQVKFHGYRVELNALRCSLNRHPRVKDSIVLVTKDQNEHDIMMAYYVARQELEMGELRAFLSETIIEEMLPNVFVHLRKLPLTLNGKVNYRALPTIEEARKRLKRTFVAPQSPTEKALAEIWTEVLGVEQVGLYDNFFELGGHSLLATLIVSRVREVLDVELPLRDLFIIPTVAGLAEHIETLRWAAQGLPPARQDNLDDYEEGVL